MLSPVVKAFSERSERYQRNADRVGTGMAIVVMALGGLLVLAFFVGIAAGIIRLLT